MNICGNKLKAAAYHNENAPVESLRSDENPCLIWLLGASLNHRFELAERPSC
jgi:hypothetical protein